jgi:DNA-binding transcriptional ArsR family regulator
MKTRENTHADALSAVGALLAEPARAAMLVALSDGTALPASELAARAGVAAGTASSHLAKLTTCGWLIVAHYGRHRYYKLADPTIATTLAQLATLAPPSTHPLPEPTSARDEPIRIARTCYGHLAGRLGVALTLALLRQDVIVANEQTYQLTGSGYDFLRRHGINATAIARQRRALARPCLDWTERRDHLGGALGVAICNDWLAHAWIERRADSRALHVTAAGSAQLAAWGIDWPMIEAQHDAP